MGWVATAVAALAAAAVPVGARADARPPEHHLRIANGRGPLHVWTPAGYDRHTAATVIYVHGYFTTVDAAWTEYHLRDQFAASGLNAMFIACEAPRSERDRVRWPSLHRLLAAVARRAGPLPKGRLVAVGHSGAHRTISRWLDDPDLDTIALVDAAYGDLDAYTRWFAERDDRRLIDVGDLLRAETDAFHAWLPGTYVVDRFPAPELGTFPDEALDARIVYVRSRLGHMELVTGGVALPMILRALEAPILPYADRRAPVTATPPPAAPPTAQS